MPGHASALDEWGPDLCCYAIIPIVTVSLSSSHQDPAPQGPSALSLREGKRETLRKAKSGAQATVQDSRGPAGNPGSPGPGPLWPLSLRPLVPAGPLQGPRRALGQFVFHKSGAMDRESGWPKATQPKKGHLWSELPRLGPQLMLPPSSKQLLQAEGQGPPVLAVPTGKEAGAGGT